MYSAKAEVILGTVSAVAASGGFDFVHDVFPIISEIGVIAGTIVALHGVYVLIKNKVKEWTKEK